MAAGLDGVAPSSASLSQWTNGVSSPSARAQLAMVTATEGEVTPLDWARWGAEVQRQVKAQRTTKARQRKRGAR